MVHRGHDHGRDIRSGDSVADRERQRVLRESNRSLPTWLIQQETRSDNRVVERARADRTLGTLPPDECVALVQIEQDAEQRTACHTT